jgi:hypothetical protein
MKIDGISAKIGGTFGLEKCLFKCHSVRYDAFFISL